MGRRKLTPDDLIIRRNNLIEKVHQDRPQIEIRGDYVNSATGIECYCTIHKHTWFPTPAELSRGKGCYICANIKNGQKTRLSQEEFSNRVKNFNSNIEIISEYVNQRTPVKCHCVIHNIEWEGKPMNLMNGENCPQCTVENKIDNHRWSKERFNAYMVQERPDIQVLGEYVNSKTKLSCKCLVCGNEWMAKPNGLKMGHGCPECSKKISSEKRKTPKDEFIFRLKQVNPHIQVIGEYINSNTKIECHCDIHNYNWETSPHSLLAGRNCPLCGKEEMIKKQTMSHEEYIDRVKAIHPQLVIKGKYIKANKRIECFCPKHNYTWYPKAYDLIWENDCKYCSREKQSKTRTHSQDDFINLVSQRNPNIEIIGIYTGFKNNVRCKCKVCNYEWEPLASTIASSTRKAYCPLCTNKVVIKGINDIATTHPYLVEYFENKNDAYTNSVHTNKKVNIKCPVCQTVSKRKISSLVKGEYHCYFCDGKVTLPNRIIRSLLKKLGVDNIIGEYSPDWSGKYRYDAYFEYNGTPYIVEMDGCFHFKSAETLGITDDAVKKTQDRDKEKDRLAEEHNITLIRIRCTPETINNIAKQIKNSLIGELFDLSNIDWLALAYYDKGKLKTICDCYNSVNGKSATNVAKILNMERHEVSRYLKKGTSIGLCNYDPIESQKAYKNKLLNEEECYCGETYET